MSRPKVTFIVPCYKLAHLLKECVDSILAQTCGDFEVLIMDDCSPDHTAEVAASIGDPRVQYIRNEPNLGHLRNYNKAIGLAAGDYIWLISADDRLRRPYVLERYLAVMDANPRVGFAFCPGIGLEDGRETEIVAWATLDQPDAVLDGRRFLRRLLESNCVLAPSGLVRRECYARVGAFPLDLPYAGDWFLWCAMALHFDVAYFAEPMVNYRLHIQSMTDTLIAQDTRLLSRDDFAVRWRIKALIEAAGDTELARHSKGTIVEQYIRGLSAKRWRGTKFRMSLQEFEQSLATHGRDAGEIAEVRRAVLAGVGPHLHWDADLELDLRLYELAIYHGRLDPKLLTKYAILRLGGSGRRIMDVASRLRARRRGLHAKGA